MVDFPHFSPNKTWNPTSIHVCHQFLLHLLLPLPFTFTDSWCVYVHACMPMCPHMRIYIFTCVSICYLRIKLGLSCPHLIWTALIAIGMNVDLFFTFLTSYLRHLIYINQTFLLPEHSPYFHFCPRVGSYNQFMDTCFDSLGSTSLHFVYLIFSLESRNTCFLPNKLL